MTSAEPWRAQATRPKLPDRVPSTGADRSATPPTGVEPALRDTADRIVDELTPVIAPELLPQVDLIVHETVERIATHRSGPLPDARELDAYRQVDASFAERIVRMAEKEQDHRHQLPNRVLEREYRLKSRGQHYALIAVAVVLLFAAYLAYQGDSKMAGYVAIGTLASIVGIFVSGRAIDARAEQRAQPQDDQED